MKIHLSIVAALCLSCIPVVAQDRPAITGVAFTRFYAKDMKASETFYRSLGYTPKSVGPVVEYTVNESQWIEIAPMPSPVPQSKQASVGLMTRDAAGMVKYLRAKGVAIDEPLHNGEFAVHDPEGHKIYFVQTGSHKLAPVSPQASSRRIIHAGFVVADRAKEEAFFRGILGFTPYWAGGRTDDSVDYVSQQVPNGSDWIEFMLNNAPDADAKTLGTRNHIALGVNSMPDTIAHLAKTGCEGCTTWKSGRDGKVQMNLYDPDLSRMEFMEFKPTGTICCSAFTGKHPTEVEDK